MKRVFLAAAGVVTATVLAGTATADATPSTQTASHKTIAASSSQTEVPAAAASRVSRTNIVRIARSQLGYAERGTTNCTKYGPCEEWCSLFATWVWRRAGVAIPKYAFTGDVYRWGLRHHLAYGKGALRRAKPGDVLLFGTGPGNTRTSTHIGIVEKVSGGRVTLIEGNSANKVRRRSYALTARTFYGGVRP